MKKITTEEQEKVLKNLITLQTNIFKISDAKSFMQSIESIAEISGVVLTIEQLERLYDATKQQTSDCNC